MGKRACVITRWQCTLRQTRLQAVKESGGVKPLPGPHRTYACLNTLSLVISIQWS